MSIEATSLTAAMRPNSGMSAAFALAGMACLPCAMHLALLPRRRTWVQTAAVSTAMLVGHPLLVAAGSEHHGTAHEGGAATGVGAVMVVVPALGLALALSGLALETKRSASTPAA